MHTLLRDIHSHLSKAVKNKVTYGLKGERVKLLSDRGNVLIVEGKNGRFSVEKEDVK